MSSFNFNSSVVKTPKLSKMLSSSVTSGASCPSTGIILALWVYI
ncbi:hypothetical protein [Clostridium acetobutylicum]|nr:hypothetical protein [Clostridium acetobutylicum]NRY56441.1 hypothetical protein [Clostridium acetobutylicum]